MRASSSLVPAVVLAVALACGGAVEGPDAQPPAALKASAPDAAATRHLDALFSGIETGCAGNDRLTGLLTSIAEPDGAGGWRPRPAVDAPLAVRDAFGAPQVIGGDLDHVRFGVAVQGATWLGLPVVGMERWLGRENGINGFAIVVDGEPATVEALLRSKLTITDSCAGDPECPIEPFVLTFAARDRQTLAVCDTSM